jgi:hypothetical protein
MSTDRVLIIAQTVWGEARGESPEGQAAVIYVILNRAQAARQYCLAHMRTRHPLFGDGSPESACLMPKQFSCRNPSDPNYSKLMALTADSPDLAPIITLIKLAQGGLLPNPIGAATHYVEQSLVGSTPWTKLATMQAHIGRHVFFNNVP